MVPLYPLSGPGFSRHVSWSPLIWNISFYLSLSFLTSTLFLNVLAYLCLLAYLCRCCCCLFLVERPSVWVCLGFLRIRLRLCILARIPWKCCCVLLSKSWQAYVTRMSPMTGVVNLDHWVKGLPPAFPTVKLSFFSLWFIGVLWEDSSRLFKIPFLIILLPTNVSAHQWFVCRANITVVLQMVIPSTSLPSTFVNWNPTVRKSCSFSYLITYSMSSSFSNNVFR